jgi:hypothetical protein
METYSFYVRVFHIRVVGIVEPVVAIVKAIHVVSVKFERVRGVNGKLIPRHSGSLLQVQGMWPTNAIPKCDNELKSR